MAHDPMRTGICEHPVDFFGDRRVFSGTAITPSMLHAYTIRCSRDHWAAVKPGGLPPRNLASERPCDAFNASVKFAKGQKLAVTSKCGSAGIESQCPAERVNVDHLLFLVFCSRFLRLLSALCFAPEGNRFNRPQCLPRRVRLFPLSSGSQAIPAASRRAPVRVLRSSGHWLPSIRL